MYKYGAAAPTMNGTVLHPFLSGRDERPVALFLCELSQRSNIALKDRMLSASAVKMYGNGPS